jgi:hypothetical protein
MSEREINVIEQKPSLKRRVLAGIGAIAVVAASAFSAHKLSEKVEVKQIPVNAEGIPCSPQDGNEEEVCQPGSTMPDKESSTVPTTPPETQPPTTTLVVTTTAETSIPIPPTTIEVPTTPPASQPPVEPTVPVKTAPPAETIPPHVG